MNSIESDVDKLRQDISNVLGYSKGIKWMLEHPRSLFDPNDFQTETKVNIDTSNIEFLLYDINESIRNQGLNQYGYGDNSDMDTSGIESKLDDISSNLDFTYTPTGITLDGVLQSHRERLQQTSLYKAVDQFNIKQHSSSAPEYSFCFGDSLGCHILKIPVHVLLFIKSILIFSCAALCRSIIFGG